MFIRFVAWFVIVPVAIAQASAVSPGDLRQHATTHSIGIEWEVTGDSNRNASCKVQFKREGATEWREALPLMRVHYAWFWLATKAEQPANMLAGSIMFLCPDVAYTVRLELTDPDGGAATRELLIRTRPVPQWPQGGRTFHVVPGSGGGTGAPDDPFQGIAAAEANAQPGDVLLLHQGDYGEAEFTRGGQDGAYLAWEAIGAARFDAIRIHASHLWLQGLEVRRRPGFEGWAIHAPNDAVDCVLTRNRVEGFQYSIALSPQCRDWTISDNVIVGDKQVDVPRETSIDIAGEGIELDRSSGHVVSYNRISHTADGISSPLGNCDIFGNDIFDVTDDGIEPDYGYANVRIWGNRLTGFGESGISFQPMRAGPWYIVRNQLIGSWQPHLQRIPHAFKFRVLDRFVCVNNTIVVKSSITWYHSDVLLLGMVRNNLFISMTGVGSIWHAKRDGSSGPPPAGRGADLPLQSRGLHTDLNDNGYDWGDSHEPFWHQGQVFTDLKEFSRSMGVEERGRRVRKEEIFEAWTIPAGAGRVEPHNLTLNVDGNAIDAGAPLHNIADCFTGQAPDLGALEYGTPPMHVGPRDVDTLHWAWY